MNIKKKVVVAMSGGVDSSVTAAVLKAEGFEVIGLTLSLFPEEKGRALCCGALESAAKARAVCDTLGLRHYLKNARSVFQQNVIDEFVRSYASGSTPNPCVECNRTVKFSYLFELAKALGADFLATGHYARVAQTSDGFALLRGLDPLKDQSYFLYCIRRGRLAELLFPLGGLTKTEVRGMAAGLGLPAAEAEESKDICFIGEGNYDRYLERRAGIRPRSGNIVDVNGKVLGRHDGFFNYTVGQRRGLGVYGGQGKGGSGERLYVTGLRPETNEVVLGDHEAACFGSFSVSNLNWLVAPPSTGQKLETQIRYRHKPCAGLVTSSGKDQLIVKFDEPQFAPARGQSVVFYAGDRVLGGGIIREVRK